MKASVETPPEKPQREDAEVPDDKVVRLAPRPRPMPERGPDPPDGDDYDDDDPGPAAA
jgi:hypothetical protein